LSDVPLLSGYDDPKALSHQITLFGTIGIDVRQSITLCLCVPFSDALGKGFLLECQSYQGSWVPPLGCNKKYILIYYVRQYWLYELARDAVMILPRGPFLGFVCNVTICALKCELSLVSDDCRLD
jgi:hypothetical protein